MPLSLTERIDSRKITLGSDGAPESAEFIYILRGVADEGTASTLAMTSTPGAYGALNRLTIDMDPVHIDTANLGACIWTLTVNFGKPQTETLGQWTFAFDTSGGSQHITQSISTVHSYANPDCVPPDYKGAIGVSKDNVDGVDIVSPVMNFTGRHLVAKDAMTGNYIVGLYQLTGKTNAAAWTASFSGVGVQFDAGEVLFKGAAISQRDDGVWEITGQFAASPNKTGITVGLMTNIAKKGWEYLWVRYWDFEDTSAKTIVKRPYAAYVEKVYEEGSFAGLVLA